MSDLVTIYSPKGDSRQFTRANAADLVQHDGWSYQAPVVKPAGEAVLDAVTVFGRVTGKSFTVAKDAGEFLVTFEGFHAADPGIVFDPANPPAIEPTSTAAVVTEAAESESTDDASDGDADGQDEGADSDSDQDDAWPPSAEDLATAPRQQLLDWAEKAGLSIDGRTGEAKARELLKAKLGL